MTLPPALDAGRHVRVDRGLRPRPPHTGVAALLSAERGSTMLLYSCRAGHVLVELRWRLSDREKQEADAAARSLAGGSPAEVAQAIGDALLCAVDFWCARVRPEEGEGA